MGKTRKSNFISPLARVPGKEAGMLKKWGRGKVFRRRIKRGGRRESNN